jgi:beta-N-acetylhexosaminidase
MTYIMTGIEGHELTEQDLNNLNHPLTCGVIFFKRNYRDYRQLLRLIRHIRALKGNDFLLAVDQEGGRVIRFALPFTQLPPLALLGATYQQDQALGLTMTHLHAWLMASELLSVGVDLSFAPVLDVDNGSEVIGDRALAQTPELVSLLGEQYGQGMRAAGMATTAKHYPGHGTVSADSHHELPKDERSFNELEQLDLKPFVHNIRAGVIDAMMLSHVIYTQVCDQPTGYSPHWCQQVLQQQHRFSGVTISDDLGMEAAKCVGDIQQRYQACVTAGVDLTLLCEPALCTELYSNKRLINSPIDKHKLIKIMRLKGQSTLSKTQPFWEQYRWQQARKAWVTLMSQTN